MKFKTPGNLYDIKKFMESFGKTFVFYGNFFNLFFCNVDSYTLTCHPNLSEKTDQMVPSSIH